MRKMPLGAGEPAPWFHARCTSNIDFCFDSVAGRYVVLCFFGSAADPVSERILKTFIQNRDRFDDTNVCFFGVSTDPMDEQLGRAREMIPGIRYFWDLDHRVCQAYGALDEQSDNGHRAIRRFTLVLDERLRVLLRFDCDDNPERHVALVLEFLSCLPAIESERPASVQAPVLVVPRVFEPELCRELIDYYERTGGTESGFMRDVDGKTVAIIDHGHKRRRDCTIEDERLRRECMIRIHDRLTPEIHKAFQFRATRMERYIVACYDSEESGHFRPHRDNTTKGTAHRRFAVSLHLNSGEYRGGQLRFPEFGRQLYTAPAGGAVVFSCSLLHEASPVTSGKRYMFLPFLYDEEGAFLRQQNEQFLASAKQNARTTADPRGPAVSHTPPTTSMPVAEPS